MANIFPHRCESPDEYFWIACHLIFEFRVCAGVLALAAERLAHAASARTQGGLVIWRGSGVCLRVADGVCGTCAENVIHADYRSGGGLV